MDGKDTTRTPAPTAGLDASAMRAFTPSTKRLESRDRGWRVRLPHEGSHESAASAVRFPIRIQPRPAIGICQRHRRHGMGERCKRRVEGYLVTANMILAVNRPRLNRGKLPRPQQRHP